MNIKNKKEMISWIKTIILAVAIGIFINQGLIVNAQIPTGSMENTIMTGEKLIALRTAYIFSDPERGDVILFYYPDDETELFVKRVVGLPGDRVEGIEGVVYINGDALEEEYVKEAFDEDFGPFDVPEDSYFMMGDNRNDSLDSRYWMNPYVQKSKIVGKALFEYYPRIKGIH